MKWHEDWVFNCLNINNYHDEYYSMKFPGARVAVNEFFADKNDKPRRHLLKSYDFERWFVRKHWEESFGG